jgi:hypothetical protein
MSLIVDQLLTPRRSLQPEQGRGRADQRCKLEEANQLHPLGVVSLGLKCQQFSK